MQILRFILEKARDVTVGLRAAEDPLELAMPRGFIPKSFVSVELLE